MLRGGCETGLVSESGPLRLTVEWESEEERRQWEKAVKQPQTEEASYLLSILSARGSGVSDFGGRRRFAGK